jgi:hypothetical protein
MHCGEGGSSAFRSALFRFRNGLLAMPSNMRLPEKNPYQFAENMRTTWSADWSTEGGSQ